MSDVECASRVNDGRNIILHIELINLIFDYVMCSATFKAILQTSKYMNNTHKHKKYSKKYNYCNLLWTLIKKYPNERWDWKLVSCNPNTTLAIFEKNKELYPLSTQSLSYNPNLTIEYVKEYIEYPWKWIAVSANAGITTQNIDDNPNLPWEYYDGVSRNPNVTMEYVKNNPNKLWSVKCLSSNAGITMKDIEDNPNPNFGWTVITSWDYNCITINPNLTLDFVKKHKNKFTDDTGDFCEIAMHPNITLEDIKSMPELCHWDSFCVNRNITLEMLEDYVESANLTDVDWSEISSNPNLTIEFIENHPNISFEWFYVFSNMNVTEEWIDELYVTRNTSYCIDSDSHMCGSRFNKALIDFKGLSSNLYNKRK